MALGYNKGTLILEQDNGNSEGQPPGGIQLVCDMSMDNPNWKVEDSDLQGVSAPENGYYYSAYNTPEGGDTRLVIRFKGLQLGHLMRLIDLDGHGGMSIVKCYLYPAAIDSAYAAEMQEVVASGGKISEVYADSIITATNDNIDGVLAVDLDDGEAFIEFSDVGWGSIGTSSYGSGSEAATPPTPYIVSAVWQNHTSVNPAAGVFTLEMSDTTDVESYNIYFSPGEGQEFEYHQLKKTSSAANGLVHYLYMLSDENSPGPASEEFLFLSSNTYGWRVTAVNTDGVESGPSNYAEFTVPSQDSTGDSGSTDGETDTGLPSAPSGTYFYVFSPTGSSHLQVQFVASDDDGGSPITEYKVYVSGPGGEYTDNWDDLPINSYTVLASTVNGVGTGFTWGWDPNDFSAAGVSILNLTEDGYYAARVSAVNAVGEGPKTDWAKTQFTAPSAGAISIALEDGTSVTADLNPVTGEILDSSGVPKFYLAEGATFTASSDGASGGQWATSPDQTVVQLDQTTGSGSVLEGPEYYATIITYQLPNGTFAEAQIIRYTAIPVEQEKWSLAWVVPTGHTALGSDSYIRYEVCHNGELPDSEDLFHGARLSMEHSDNMNAGRSYARRVDQFERIDNVLTPRRILDVRYKGVGANSADSYGNSQSILSTFNTWMGSWSDDFTWKISVTTSGQTNEISYEEFTTNPFYKVPLVYTDPNVPNDVPKYLIIDQIDFVKEEGQYANERSGVWVPLVRKDYGVVIQGEPRVVAGENNSGGANDPQVTISILNRNNIVRPEHASYPGPLLKNGSSIAASESLGSFPQETDHVYLKTISLRPQETQFFLLSNAQPATANKVYYNDGGMDLNIEYNKDCTLEHLLAYLTKELSEFETTEPFKFGILTRTWGSSVGHSPGMDDYWSPGMEGFWSSIHYQNDGVNQISQIPNSLSDGNPNPDYLPSAYTVDALDGFDWRGRGETPFEESIKLSYLHTDYGGDWDGNWTFSSTHGPVGMGRAIFGIDIASGISRILNFTLHSRDSVVTESDIPLATIAETSTDQWYSSNHVDIQQRIFTKNSYPDGWTRFEEDE